MALYVCFDDSATNPTYVGVDAAFLIESNVDPNTDENPCAYEHSEKEISVLPSSAKEIKVFADFMGWELSADSEGNIVLNTGVRT